MTITLTLHLAMSHTLALLAAILAFITYPATLANCSREWQSKWFWARCILVSAITYGVTFGISYLILMHV